MDANVSAQPQTVYKDGGHVSTFSRSSKVKPKKFQIQVLPFCAEDLFVGESLHSRDQAADAIISSSHPYTLQDNYN